MTTTRATDHDGMAPCGCPATDAERGRHNHVCLISQTVHVHTDWLHTTPKTGLGLRPLLLADLAAANPVWGRDEVLPDKAVLSLTAPVPPGVELGLWQRQGPDLVPLSDTEYVGGVDSCTYGSCGLCDSCFRYRSYVENTIADTTDAIAAVAAARKAVADALAAWNKVAANGDGGNGELSSVDAEHGRRGLTDAGYHLRVTEGVLAQHVNAVRAMDPSREDLD